ncbi:MAG: shikimate kinase [Alkaliphilus sp.]
MKDNIILIGMMGAGKTTIGKQVAKLLGYSFVDTDILVAKKMKMSIEEIFLKHGEESFRKIEQEIVEELHYVNNAVIATGGGIILSPRNRKKLIKMGMLFYLNATSNWIIKNLESTRDDRPLLFNVEKQEKIEQLITERKSSYKIARYEIVVDNKSVLEISKKIIEIYSKSKKYGKMELRNEK